MRGQLCQIKMPLEFAALQWEEITPPLEHKQFA